MANALFGWDLLYGSVEKDIKSDQDILVCFTHLVLVSHGFRTVGLGESKTLEGNEMKSEVLPRDWNQFYAIRYIYQGRLYNFKATIVDDGVMINLLRVDERSVSLILLNSSWVVKKKGTLDEMIPDNRNISDKIKKQLIDKVIISKKTKEMSCQTESEQDTRRNTSLIENQRPELPWGPALSVGPFPIVDPRNYGRSDLDPLGGIDPLRVPSNRGPGGGGMLFQPPGPSFGGPPLHPGNLGVPPGAIPPGARFDPFRPPDVDRSFNRRPNRPDNDEFPPPGYDDMFM
ncbi:proteasome inhibitor PI31 subunit [Leptinotarsa decemlineata]|uniref:proteasome inhibitor PI31 subunit n=1 Tax=Leptinotarsa decemlineata TaxID=7539 RepID=UPI003D305A2A